MRFDLSTPPHRNQIYNPDDGAAVWSPLSLPGLVQWLDFSDLSTLFQDTTRIIPAILDGALIGGVTDKSGVGNHGAQSTIGNKPALKLAIQNGQAVCRFDGSDDFISFTTPISLVGLSIIAAYKVTNSSDKYVMDGVANNEVALITGFNSGGFRAFEYYTGADRQVLSLSGTGMNVIAAKGNAVNLKGRFNGTQVFSVAPSVSLVGRAIHTLGKATGDGAAYDSDFAELLICDGVLSDANCALAEAYLKAKWGTP